MRARPLWDRFYDGKFEREPMSGCWLWTAAVSSDGYGNIGIGAPSRKIEGAHRVSWRLHRGEIPFKMEVCHRCDTPPCVNPAHLFLGTHLENIRDMCKKGRGDDRSTRSGEQHYFSKLTEPDVIEIRRMLDAGERQVDIAARFGVGQNHVSRIKLRESWQHVPETPTQLGLFK